MNLEKINLVEMSSQEVKEVEGGLWGEITGAVLASGPIGWGLAATAGVFALGFYNGYNNAQN